MEYRTQHPRFTHTATNTVSWVRFHNLVATLLRWLGRWWGEEMLVAVEAYRSRTLARALTFVEAYSIDRDTLYGLAAAYPDSNRRLKMKCADRHLGRLLHTYTLHQPPKNTQHTHRYTTRTRTRHVHARISNCCVSDFCVGSQGCWISSHPEDSADAQPNVRGFGEEGFLRQDAAVFRAASEARAIQPGNWNGG